MVLAKRPILCASDTRCSGQRVECQVCVGPGVVHTGEQVNVGVGARLGTNRSHVHLIGRLAHMLLPDCTHFVQCWQPLETFQVEFQLFMINASPSIKYAPWILAVNDPYLTDSSSKGMFIMAVYCKVDSHFSGYMNSKHQAFYGARVQFIALIKWQSE